MKWGKQWKKKWGWGMMWSFLPIVEYPGWCYSQCQRFRQSTGTTDSNAPILLMECLLMSTFRCKLTLGSGGFSVSESWGRIAAAGGLGDEAPSPPPPVILAQFSDSEKPLEPRLVQARKPVGPPRTPLGSAAKACRPSAAGGRWTSWFSCCDRWNKSETRQARWSATSNVKRR